MQKNDMDNTPDSNASNSSEDQPTKPPALASAQESTDPDPHQFPKFPNGLKNEPCPKCNSINARIAADGHYACDDCRYRWAFELHGRVLENTFLGLAVGVGLLMVALIAWDLPWLVNVGVTGNVAGAPPIPIFWVLFIGLIVMGCMISGYRNLRIKRLREETSFAPVLALVKKLQSDGALPHIESIRECVLDPEKQQVFYNTFFELAWVKQQKLLMQIRSARNQPISERFNTYLASKGEKYRKEHIAFWESLQPPS